MRGHQGDHRVAVQELLTERVGREGTWREVRFRSSDGLELYARDYGPLNTRRLPVLILSGLTRNSKDAHPLAVRLAPRRRVIALDYRGRGLSQYAADWSTYRVDVEMADAIALLDLLRIERMVLIGTSRGGLIGMLLAAHHRDRLAGLLLNDIGPVLEPPGLVRIRSYLGRKPRFTTWKGAVAALKATNPGFDLEEEEWLEFARRLFRDEGGRPLLDYDPNLRLIFPTRRQIERGFVKPMWDLFEAVRGIPAAALRGEHSDLLSRETLARMAAEVADLDTATVKGRGHAPFLDEPESLAAVDRLLARTG